MVTFLRPHPQAHGPAAVDVRLRIRSKLQSSSSSLVPCGCRSLSLSLSPSMAQDPSQTKDQDTADTNPQQPQEIIAQQEPAASTSSSSSSGGDTAGSWLQLGVGGQSGPGSPSSSSARRPSKRPRTDYEAAGPSRPAGPAPPPLLPELGLSLFPESSASASASASAAPVVAAAPPPAHEAGTWFVLQAAENQRTEPPPLPQIPRSYLRVRDGRMTVRLVMSYLVNKLGLEDDSQLEITCRGQRLLPAMTLQHVRDTIWRPQPAEAAAVLPAPGSSSTNQVMTLHYGRS